MIVRTPTGAVIAGDAEVNKQNAGDGYVNGVEFNSSYRFHPQLTAFGAFAWTYGKIGTFPTADSVTEDEPISRLMPPTGRFGLRWDHPRKKMWMAVSCTMADQADTLSTRDKQDTSRIPPGGTPAWATVNLHGGWEITDGLEVFGGLENITNTAYRIHGSGVNEPGVNFKVGARWRF